MIDGPTMVTFEIKGVEPFVRSLVYYQQLVGVMLDETLKVHAFELKGVSGLQYAWHVHAYLKHHAGRRARTRTEMHRAEYRAP